MACVCGLGVILLPAAQYESPLRLSDGSEVFVVCDSKQKQAVEMTAMLPRF